MSELNIEFINISKSYFLMGAAPSDLEADSEEKPQRKVWLSDYKIQKFPLTVRDWKLFLEECKYNWPFEEWKENCIKFFKFLPTDEYPITFVSWFDCKNFIDWLNNKEKQFYSLPTEAQWEKACRGDNGNIYPWSEKQPFWEDEFDINPDWQNMIFPIGHNPHRSTIYGCMDMWDNVLEWCEDWYDDNYYQKKELVDPCGPFVGEYKIVRGGNMLDSGWPRCSSRNYMFPGTRHISTGFRLASKQLFSL